MDRNRFTEGIKNIFRVIIWPIGVYLLFFLLSKLLKAGEFGSFNSIKMIFLQAVPNAIVAWGIIGNMMSGRWDFSIGGMIVLLNEPNSPALSSLLSRKKSKYTPIGHIITLNMFLIPSVNLFLSIVNYPFP
jgi:ribose/xylose/arabinose/galactoside ABC-type transport system permease subunit